LDYRAIGATGASTRSKTADPKGESTVDEFRCAGARQFDRVARLIQQQRGAVRCSPPEAS